MKAVEKRNRKEYFKDYRRKNKRRIKERDKKYQKKYYGENKEYYKEYGKKYNQTTKAKLRRKYRTYKFTDKRDNLSTTVDFSFDDFLYFLSTNKCVYCDSNINLGLDRIDNNKGHSKDNVLVCCLRCNTLRSNKFTVNEMKQIGQVLKKIDRDRVHKIN